MKTRSLLGARFFVALLSCCILLMADYAEAQRGGGGRGGGGGGGRGRRGCGRCRRWHCRRGRRRLPRRRVLRRGLPGGGGGGHDGGGGGHRCGGLFGITSRVRSGGPAVLGEPVCGERHELLPVRLDLVHAKLRQRKRRLCRDRPTGLIKLAKQRR